VTAPAARQARRRFIVSGDDFGLASEVNHAVLRAHAEGILTSTSLMVTGASAREAVELAQRAPRLAVGLHLVLVQGRPAAPLGEIAGLARPDGRFRESAIPAGLAYYFSPRLRRVVRREVGAQLEMFRATGLPLSHVDGHLNIHLHPFVQLVLADMVPRFGIRAIRLTREPILRNLRWDLRHPLRKTFEGLAFQALSALAARRFARLGVVSTDHLFGLHQTGAFDERYLRHLIATLPPGDSELYCHPAIEQNAEMRRVMPGYRQDAELAALVSPGLRDLAEQHGVELATYADLAQGA
jgi:hopanoid biosynthesis associated protein HpnK